MLLLCAAACYCPASSLLCCMWRQQAQVSPMPLKVSTTYASLTELPAHSAFTESGSPAPDCEIGKRVSTVHHLAILLKNLPLNIFVLSPKFLSRQPPVIYSGPFQGAWSVPSPRLGRSPRPWASHQSGMDHAVCTSACRTGL